MDEWLFYYALYKLFKSKYYKIMTIVCLYGLSCIYTSYSNIEKIEYKLTGIPQMIWLFNLSSFNYIKKITGQQKTDKQVDEEPEKID